MRSCLTLVNSTIFLLVGLGRVLELKLLFEELRWDWLLFLVRLEMCYK